MAEIKKELRKKVREYARSLPEEYIELSDRGIYENVIALPEYKNARSVMLFYSLGREPDTHELIKKCLADGKVTTLPVSYSEGIMKARIIGSLDELKPDMWGIPSPTEDAPVLERGDIDLIIVPAVAFARNGYRLGQGGGYYDRYLAGFEGDTVGIVRSKIMLDDVPRDKYDMAVKCVVSETETLYIG